MNINDFKTLLINRNEIEKILGKTITIKNSEYEYLEDYAMFPEINLSDVVAIFLGLDPKGIKTYEQNRRYITIYNAIERTVRDGEIDAKIDQDFDINGNEVQFDIWLSHDTAKAWAKTYGFKWDVPPYRQLVNDKKLEAEKLSKPEISESEKDLTIKQLQAENDKLKAEIAELKGQSSPKIINYNNSSIYGHSSENLELVFRLSKVIAKECDIDNPHSYPTKKDFEDYIKKYYSDSLKLCEAFYQILIPNKVKNRGRTPKGVDTFKGFT